MKLNRREYLTTLAAAAGLIPNQLKAQTAASTSFLKLPQRFQTNRAVSSTILSVNEKATVATLDGPGCIRHIWMGLNPKPMFNRNAILRIFFDDEPNPSVEAPVGDFFGMCHGIPYYPLTSVYLTAQDQSGYNCYFPMPFARTARFELARGAEPCGAIYVHIDWHRYPQGSLNEPTRFHAAWRREFPTQAFGEEYLILDAIGRGRLMGFTYGVRLYDMTARWSHGGSDNIYIDGEGTGEDFVEPCVIRGSGGEDTFGAAYGGVLHKPESHPYMGMPYYAYDDVGTSRAAHRLAAYRFFEQDGIEFEKSVHFRFGCVANDICSTAYWYQAEPHRPFVTMPPFSKLQPGVELPRGSVDLLRQTGSTDPNAPSADPADGEWWLCGPFENDKGQGMERRLPPEQGARPDPKARYDGQFGAESPWRQKGATDPDQHLARWKRRPSFHGFVDFNHAFRPTGPQNNPTWPAAACALATYHCPADTDAVLHLTWDDRMLLYCNDEPARDLGEQASFRQRHLHLRLHRGDNRILLKSNNTKGLNWGAWCFNARLMLTSGQTLIPLASL